MKDESVMALTFDIVKIVLLVLILAAILKITLTLKHIAEDKTLRVTEVHHNTPIKNYYGDLPWSEKTKVTVVKEK